MLCSNPDRDLYSQKSALCANQKKFRMNSQDNKLIRLLIVDDHPLIRVGLRALFDKHTHLQIVGEAGNCADALAIAVREHPDIILLDLNLGCESGISFLAQLRVEAKDARVLVLTGIGDVSEHTQAMRAGAIGLVMKEKAPELLLKAIERVYDGEMWFDRAMMQQALAEINASNQTAESDDDAANIAALTPRECEIIALVCEGLKNKQIAERTFISEKTVRHHLSSIFSKLVLTNRLELVLYAHRHSLVKLR